MKEKTIQLILLTRVHQWIKNTFIFLPLFFSAQVLDSQKLITTTLCALGFSLIASAVYVFNDLCDINVDKLHPEKKKRPLASGAINRKEGVALIIFLLLAGTSIIAFSGANPWIFTLIGLYLFQNFLYSVSLKHIALLDVTLIAIGFVLRVLIGGVAGDIELSSWIIIMTFLLACFLAISKRYDDVRIMESTSVEVRKNLNGYNLSFVTIAMAILAATVIISYILYTVSPSVTQRLGEESFYTSLFVTLGILRYLQLTIVHEKSESPTKVLLRDTFLQTVILLWVCSFAFILYL
ncbi:decaprenyl-phosphate phosphoribosyltransferase [Fulvitalea axinellae]|uniref:Decaprenyl-phosphate phosphoribosyltransferase n=1 Tax=Fulvitalea axinellae TaxID=1182444 RepID=A0AAU9CMS7_9BACT|nr:decaprenyl-phosphate phosphoribosyltransferase [Fulvitalea axinellae]